MSDLTLKIVADRDQMAENLSSSALSVGAVLPKAALFAQSAEALLQQGLPLTSAVMAWFVPGRIEVLGKHTDYAGGRSLTVAAERGFCCLAVRRKDANLRVIGAKDSKMAEFPLDPDLPPNVGHWSNYPRTVARRIARNFPDNLSGADIAFASDIPIAAGMSSSSAFVIAILELLADVNQLASRDEYRQNIRSQIDLADYAAAVETGPNFRELTGTHGVGTLGGSEDHTAILCSRQRQLGQFSYCPGRHERWVAMPDEFVFAIASSGVVAEKTGAAMEKYNRVSKLASAAAEVWRDATGRDDPHLAAAIASSAAASEELREVLRKNRHAQFEPDELLNRFEQFLAESEEIIPAAAEALEQRDVDRFGELVDRSQSLGAQLLQNQVPETIHLAQSARELGAAAGSAFGAGFGGSVWAFIQKKEVEVFLKRWNDSYRTAFPQHSDRSAFFTTNAGPAAFCLEGS